MKQKYVMINWQNLPSHETPLNSTNLDWEEQYLKYISDNAVEYEDLPTKLSDLTNDEEYQTLTQINTLIAQAISEVGTILVFRGVVNNYTELLALTGLKSGYVYKVLDDSDIPSPLKPMGTNVEYWYNTDHFEYLGSDEVIQLEDYYNKSAIDTLLTSKISADSIKAIRYNNGEFEYTTDNTNWTTLLSGHNGENGATFIPSVDDEGYISWSNDKSLPNPATKNIKGTKGDTGYSPTIAVYESSNETYKLQVTNESSTFVTPNLKGANGQGSGDMEKATYDTNNNGIVDKSELAQDSEKLGNQLPSYYAKASDYTTLNTQVGTNTTNISTNTTDISNIKNGVTKVGASSDSDKLESHSASYFAKQSDMTSVSSDVDTIKGDYLTSSSLTPINNKLAITRSTLSSGETSITISDTHITTDSVLTFYTSKYGVNPKSVSVITGNVTLTFDTQSEDLEVGVQVNG